jgi:cytochrome c biogenesis protein CcdA
MMRNLLATVLLALAAGSALWLVIKHFQPPEPAATSTALERGSARQVDRLVVTYFHTNQRCEKCRRIEAWSREAVESAFAAQLADGRIEWEVINFDEPQHRHLAIEYRLVAPVLVLVEMHEATPMWHSYAGEVWNLIEDKPAFLRYVQGEVRQFQEGREASPFLKPEAPAKVHNENPNSPPIPPVLKPEAPAKAPAEANRPSLALQASKQGYWLALLLALWLGLQTAISPCPLATNIAAISFLGRKLDDRRRVFLAGLAYTLGRTLAYVVLAAAILSGLAANANIADFFRRTLAEFLGPILIVIALLMLDLLRPGFSGPEISPAFHRRVERWGLAGAVLLGILFALSFCPYSAALFFSLIPLAAQYRSGIVLPAVYGVATALPVIVFAAIIALSVRSVGKAFARLSQFERYTRWIAGGVFLAGGIYFTIRSVWLSALP